MGEAVYTITESHLRRIIRASIWESKLDPPRTVEEICNHALDLRDVVREGAYVERVYPVPDSFLRALLRLATEERYVDYINKPKSAALRLDKLAAMLYGYLDGIEDIGILCRTCAHREEHAKDTTNHFQPLWFCEGFVQLPLMNGCPHADHEVYEHFYHRVKRDTIVFDHQKKDVVVGGDKVAGDEVLPVQP